MIQWCQILFDDLNRTHLAWPTLPLSCNVTSLLWSISYLVSNQSVVPTKRTNHVELSHQLNSLVHSCTVYKSRWQGTNWRLSMALASVTQISTKCLYFPCLIKKNHSPFTSSTSQQTYYFKDWQYSILFDSFCMNWDLEQRERYMCVFVWKSILHNWCKIHFHWKMRMENIS